MPRRKPPVIADALLDQLLDGADARTAFDTDGVLDQLKKALAERALNAEMDHHLVNGESGNSRNGYGRKTVTTGTGKIELEIPRDRAGSFDPALIAKYQRLPGLRREDHLHVRPRHERARDRRARPRALRGRGLAGPDQRPQALQAPILAFGCAVVSFGLGIRCLARLFTIVHRSLSNQVTIR